MMETQHWSHLDSIDITNSAGNDCSNTFDQSAGQGNRKLRSEEQQTVEEVLQTLTNC